ncbi:MAG: response regulator transcription factor [Bacillota bacterium]
MENPRVLIIDDDEHICKILKDYFEYENFKVVTALTGKQGLELVEKEDPDIIILDIMLPELDGWEVCKELRPQNETPIIILSAKDEESERISGLELGADDYVTKPFSPREVVVRAKTILRRIQDQNIEKNSLKFDDLVINKENREVRIGDQIVNLTPKEFDLLWELAFSPKKVFSRDKLLKNVWGYDYFGDQRTVDTHIKSLRNKLGEPIASYIKTVWGVGYKFEVEE